MTRPLAYGAALRLVVACLGCAWLTTGCTETRDYRDRDRTDRRYGERRDRDRDGDRAYRSRGRLDVESARYGVDGAFCDPEDAIERAARRAQREDGRSGAFTITVNNDLCGDPAPRRAKRLFVSFHCGDGPTLRAQAGEGQTITLDCAR